jgi:hypothetical protein
MDASSHFDICFFHSQERALSITKIRLCILADKGSKPNVGVPCNRWIILLEVAPLKRIKLELQPGITGRKLGVVVFLDIAEPEQIIHEIELARIGKPTVGRLMRDLVALRLNRYKFTAFEEGGRYWVFRVVRE